VREQARLDCDRCVAPPVRLCHRQGLGMKRRSDSFCSCFSPAAVILSLLNFLWGVGDARVHCDPV
jgi:hypothetical protein